MKITFLITLPTFEKLACNNISDFLITEKKSKNIYFQISEGNSENITVIACCNAAGQFPSHVVIFTDFIKIEEFGDGLHSGSDTYRNRK
jgi:hypothetical protein